MAQSRAQSWPMALLAIIVAAPASFVMGIAGTGVWQTLRGPPGSGEGVQADAYSALFIGGPVGFVVGSVLVGWLTLRYAERASWPARAVVFGVLAAASLFAVRLLGSH